MTTVVFDLRQLSGIVPETVNLTNARIDFSPYKPLHVQDGGDDYWLTRNILRIRLQDGVGSEDLPPTPLGSAYEVQERGFRGARKGYVIVPDLPTVDYGDLVWVDKDTLDPTLPLDPAWLASLAAESAARTAADVALGVRIDNVGGYYLHTQTIPSADWAIVHNLGVRPNIQVLIANEVIGVPVTHTDVNTAHAVFSTPQTGKAVCS